jgi:hypothetical protein
LANFDKQISKDDNDPSIAWVPLHVAQLCRCGYSFQSITHAPAQSTAYTVFYPQGGSHVFADPDLKSFIQTTLEFKKMVDTLAGGSLDIAQADTPQLLVALDTELQFITAEKAENKTFRCHYNECTNNLMQTFIEISAREEILIKTYEDLSQLKMQNEISPLPTVIPTPSNQAVTIPSQPLQSGRQKRNVWDLFFGQSTATLAEKVCIHVKLFNMQDRGKRKRKIKSRK